MPESPGTERQDKDKEKEKEKEHRDSKKNRGETSHGAFGL